MTADEQLRELRQQYRAWERSSYDGHSRRSLAGPGMAQLKKRAQRRRAKQRVLERMR